MSKILIKGSGIVTPEGLFQGDMLISEGQIERIAPSIPLPSSCREIKAEGLITIPGIIDPHVHMELEAYGSRSCDCFAAGSMAGAVGGVTSYIDFAIPRPGESMADAFRRKADSASGRSITDYTFHAQITTWNSEKTSEMDEVVAEGIGSFKVFMPATEGWGVDDLGLYEALLHSIKTDSLILVHAENGSIVEGMRLASEKSGKTSVKDYPASRPAFSETEAVIRAAYLARKASAPLYVCHISAGESVSEIKRLRRSGEDIFAETCPQYLFLEDSVYSEKEGYRFVCAPPLRDKENLNGVWRGIIEGTVDTIGTDHCPFTLKEKKAGQGSFLKTPMGLPGIGSSFPLMYTGGVIKRKLDLNTLVRLISENPARIFGLYPRKGALIEGSDADIAVFNPDESYYLSETSGGGNSDWNPYKGFEVSAKVLYTISRGRVVYEEGNILIPDTPGNLIPRTSPDRSN